MPRVPQTDNVIPITPDVKPPDPVFFAMAAATMHAQGRLFEPAQKVIDDKRK